MFALSKQIKGKTRCLVCLDGTTWVFLDASKKIVYLRNQRFLKTSHKYRSKLFFRFYEGVKVPTGFSANVKKLVLMKDLSITHCKAHDCHVMLIVFLPIAIRAIKPEFLKIAITHMCYFFSKIS